VQAPLENDFLTGHAFSPVNREEMIDWMFKVFKVLRGLSTKTFFVTISIMDSYFNANHLK
jgi:hypothetical protein